MIKESVINLIRKNKTCKSELQLALDKSAPTIQRYIDTNDIMLTTAVAVKVIARNLNIKESQVLQAATA